MTSIDQHEIQESIYIPREKEEEESIQVVKEEEQTLIKVSANELKSLATDAFKKIKISEIIKKHKDKIIKQSFQNDTKQILNSPNNNEHVDYEV